MKGSICYTLSLLTLLISNCLVDSRTAYKRGPTDAKYDQNDSETGIEEQLMKSMINSGKLKFIDTQKRENMNDNIPNENSHKECYKLIYQNVLDAFENAMKSQVDSYKECICKKKPQESKLDDVFGEDSVVMVINTTTEPIALHIPDIELDSDLKPEQDGEPIGRYVEDGTDFSGNPEDLICFHKKYAIILNKLVEAIDRDSGNDVNKMDQLKPLNGPLDVNMLQEFPRGKISNRQVKRNEKYEDINRVFTSKLQSLFRELQQIERANRQSVRSNDMQSEHPTKYSLMSTIPRSSRAVQEYSNESTQATLQLSKQENESFG